MYSKHIIITTQCTRVWLSDGGAVFLNFSAAHAQKVFPDGFSLETNLWGAVSVTEKTLDQVLSCCPVRFSVLHISLCKTLCVRRIQSKRLVLFYLSLCAVTNTPYTNNSQIKPVLGGFYM